MSINRVVISGNLTRNPELRCTQSGLMILSFCVAVNDRRKNPLTGEWENYANYIDVKCFGARAAGLSETLEKGLKVSVEGKLRWSQWEKDGRKHSRIEVIMDEIDFLAGKRKQGEGQEGGKGDAVDMQVDCPAASAPAPASSSNLGVPEFEEVEGVYDDDIPF